MRNERHCGDVLTRKTFTPDVISHKSKKNRGERQQSLYKGEHEAIVSRDDYIAVQHMINNAKYGGKSILPELRVIESGVLKGFVTISPKWAGFKAADYLQASMSVYTDDTYYGQPAEGDATLRWQLEILICAALKLRIHLSLMRTKDRMSYFRANKSSSAQIVSGSSGRTTKLNC